MRDFAPCPLLINQAVWLSNARTLRKSGSPAPGTTAACQVAPPSSVRRYAPPAPLAQTTAGLTALTPRKDAVVPLDCATHVCGSATEAAATPVRHSASVGQCNSLIPLNRILQIGYPICRARPTPLNANSLVSGKVLCGGQQTLSIQCRGGNLSEKRFERRAAENWAGAPLPRFSTMRDAHRPVRFLRVDRPSPSPGVSEMRGPLRRSSSAEEAFLLGSVLSDGLRATDLPREPAGHRSLPPIRDRETLSPGVSRHGGAQHSGRRQRNTRLAHLRRVCPCLD